MADADELLKPYRAKRDFEKTAEPSGSKPKKSKKAAALSFVIQKHAATRLHFDFRLELDGVLKSWAVTKGPSLNPADKRLAVHVEDHPLDYGTFEGTIPKGQYGGGTVMLWDRGTWEPIGDPHQGLEKGDFKFRLQGERMRGEWVLVRLKPRAGEKRENWLLIKHRDGSEDEDGEKLVREMVTSIDTGRDMDAIARGDAAVAAKGKRKSAEAAQAGGGGKVWTHGKAVALPAFRPPQLATLVDEVPSGRDWLFEMKYDGYRCVAAVAGEEVRLYTRNANDWTQQFAPLRAPLGQVTGGSALIDGEVCALAESGRTDFSTLKDALSTGAPLVFFAFDLIEQDGEDLSRLPLIERKERLRKLLGDRPKNSPIHFSDHVRGKGEKFFDAMCQGGFEGVIAKEVNSPYSGDRTKTWLKIKCIQRQEFVIGGWRPSDKRKHFASLLLGTWEDGKLVYRGRVGTGFTEESAEALQASLDERAKKTSPFSALPRDVTRLARFVEPNLVAEVAFTEITPDGVLRHPSFLGLREDKSASAVKLEKAAPTPEVAPLEAKATPEPKSAAKPKRAAKPAAEMELTQQQGVAAAEKIGIRLTSPDRVVYPEDGITKGELIAYYAAVADAMLPYVGRRPLSLVRCPQGRAKYCFFQKHDSGAFPAEMKKVAITEKDGHTEDYFYVEDLAGLAAGVQMNTLEYHIWGSLVDDVERAERIIFDIDPDEGLGFDHVRKAAMDIRDGLAKLGLKTFPLLSGGKGVHVIAPLTPKADWVEIKAFCKAFVQNLSDREPDRFVANMSKAKRKGRMFLDYLRNERGSTAISPYSTRSRQGAPVATPITWKELETVAGANIFSIRQAAARAQGPDPWKGYFGLDQAVTPELLKAVGA